MYAFDRNERTFCCELTPSYCLMFLAADCVPVDTLSDDEREALYELVIDGSRDTEHVMYMHCRDVDRMLEEHPERMRKVEIDAPDQDLAENESWNKAYDELCEGWSTGSWNF